MTRRTTSTVRRRRRRERKPSTSSGAGSSIESGKLRGSGSAKPDGTLFEWLIADFSVYDAFESGLVKVVRLPDPEEQGSQYLDLWDLVKGARSKEEYLSACK